jgi:hypothetical protein
MTAPHFKNTEAMKVVFTAQSKQYFYCRDVICEWVLKQGCLPLNPFRVFDYFLGDRVDRDLIRRGNNNLIRMASELWVFGIVADGVLFEIDYALSLGTPIRFFTLGTRSTEIKEITNLDEVKFEPEVHSFKMTRPELLRRIGSQSGHSQLDLFSAGGPLPRDLVATGRPPETEDGMRPADFVEENEHDTSEERGDAPVSLQDPAGRDRETAAEMSAAPSPARPPAKQSTASEGIVWPGRKRDRLIT